MPIKTHLRPAECSAHDAHRASGACHKFTSCAGARARASERVRGPVARAGLGRMRSMCVRAGNTVEWGGDGGRKRAYYSTHGGVGTAGGSRHLDRQCIRVIGIYPEHLLWHTCDPCNCACGLASPRPYHPVSNTVHNKGPAPAGSRTRRGTQGAL